ncbi:MAG: PP2C family protein-serine/threonine phosphatase, partial [Acidobacteriota bacterium]
ACVPLRTPKGEIIGALEAINRLNDKDFTEADLSLFSVLADQATIALERARLQKESVEKQLLEKELGLAYEIQKGFWPKELPSYPGFSVAAMSLPARHVGGDYYDFIALNPNVWAVAIGDVSGKGTSAALLMASLRTMLRTQVENGLSIEETIYRLNNILIKDIPLDKFSSLLYGILDFEAGEFTYVNAGHPPPLLYDSAIPGVRSLGLVGGPPIGIQENLQIASARQKLRSGQAMILFTDGIPEARSRSGEFFGEDGLRAVVSEHATGDAQTLMEQIHGAVQDFAQGQPLADDLTLIVIKVEGRGSSLSDKER